MSCRKCEERDSDNVIAYFRWKNANIGMIGCDEHLIEIFNALNEAQRNAKTKELEKGADDIQLPGVL